MTWLAVKPVYRKNTFLKDYRTVILNREMLEAIKIIIATFPTVCTIFHTLAERNRALWLLNIFETSEMQSVDKHFQITKVTRNSIIPQFKKAEKKEISLVI